MLEDTNNYGNEISVKAESQLGPIVGVVLFLVAIFIYIFLALPYSNALSEMKADINSKLEKIDELKGRISEIEVAEEKFDISTEVQKLETLKAIPIGLDQDEVIKDLVNLAEQNDISLGSISFGKGNQANDGIGSLRISSGFDGNYSDLIDFLEDIEQNGRLLKVGSISVQINKLEILEVDRANFTLSMEAFYQN